MDDMDGKGLGFDMVIGRDPDIGVRFARGGPALEARLMAREFIEVPNDESKIDASEGVCSPVENQSLLLSSELGKRSSES
jgi:hypothetical protein